eukprot:3852410-Rhodomonas_salina.3
MCGTKTAYDAIQFLVGLGYTVHGTEVGYDATRFLVVLREPVERDRAWSAEMRYAAWTWPKGTCYAMPGTDVCYAATSCGVGRSSSSWLVLPAYARPMPYPVLIQQPPMLPAHAPSPKSLKEGKWEDLHHGFYDDSLQALVSSPTFLYTSYALSLISLHAAYAPVEPVVLTQRGGTAPVQDDGSGSRVQGPSFYGVRLAVCQPLLGGSSP